MKDVDIDVLRPANIPQVIVEVVKIGLLRTATIPQVIIEDIIVVMSVEMDIGHKIPATIPLVVGEQELMLKGEVDKGLIPVTITPVNQLTVVYC